MSNSIVTRFAPSPTGFLHIGSARTALFNWLYAKHHGGTFLLRIEDTDRVRSTEEAIATIFDGMTWLGLNWDGDAIFQFERADKHAAAAHRLLEEGKAYRCYATPEELEAMRAEARAAGRPVRYDGRWRDRDPAEAPVDIDPVIRLKAPTSGSTSIVDLIQGEVTVANDQLDDMVLLRADGTPTYMLAVVVDDYDMGVTHVIRGDDHLTNTFRQIQLYRALDWPVPTYAHMSLIHGADGAKLSKRHGALGVSAYREMGFLPEAVCNYLLRLGWGHGDDEIIDRAQAIEWFDLSGVGRSPARFDMARLTSLNAHYLRKADDQELADDVIDRLRNRLNGKLAPNALQRILRGISGLKERAKTLVELAENASIYAVDAPIPMSDGALRLLNDQTKCRLRDVKDLLSIQDDWSAAALENVVRNYVEDHKSEVKLKDVAQPLRAAITGQTISPPIFEVMSVLGRSETVARLNSVLMPETHAL